MDLTRRNTLIGLVGLPLVHSPVSEQIVRSYKLISAAREQVGVTTLYDPSYVALNYPNGDVAADRGVCIDVIIRAYRVAFGFDFQAAIHDDMVASFSAYPQLWGLRRTDRNIDHRRVPNIEKWLTRHGHEIDDHRWMPGDLLTCRVGGSLPHIGIISTKRGPDRRFRAIHNIGLGTLEDSRIWAYGTQRRFRFLPQPIS